MASLLNRVALVARAKGRIKGDRHLTPTPRPLALAAGGVSTLTAFAPPSNRPSILSCRALLS